MKRALLVLGLLGIAVIIATVILSSSPTPAQWLSIHTAMYVAYLVGGLFLAAAPFDRKRVRSHWARLACGLAATALVFVGITELLGHYHVGVLGREAEHGLYSTLWLLRGVGFGLLLLLLLSGELRAKTPNQAMQRTAGRSAF